MRLINVKYLAFVKHIIFILCLFMRVFRVITIIAVLTAVSTSALCEYVDHRFHNIDSLECSLADNSCRFNPACADSLQQAELLLCYSELMLGYLQINGSRSEYCARQVIQIARLRQWYQSYADACRIIGQIRWSAAQYDSASYWLNLALGGVDSMAICQQYNDFQIDNMYSVVYGALGNLNVDRDSIDVALRYYELAGQLFEKHGWIEQLAVLYNNESELYRRLTNNRRALECAKTSYSYAQQSGDSLMIAMSNGSLADSYVALRQYRKALKCASVALNYYKAHKLEEAKSLSESFETINGIYQHQKNISGWIAVCILVLSFMVIVVILMWRRKTSVVRQSNTAVFNIDTPDLNDREQQILNLIVRGMTTPQIAESIFLSPETVKWYRKRLLSKFNVKNTAELIAKMSGMGGKA